MNSDYTIKNILAGSDSDLLLSDILKISRNELYVNFNKKLSMKQLSEYRKLIKKRNSGYPLDYILGHSVFMGLKFEVNADTLIPRQETELLVEKCLEFIEGKSNPEVLEIGAGCGNIAVTLAKFADCRVVSVEKSSRALRVARKNALKHGVSDKITFIKGDMFNRLRDISFDCLISNPPYVKYPEYAGLPEEVKKEPKLALIGGKDGLKYINKILKEARPYVRAGGKIFIEIGYNQKEDVEKIIINSSFREYQFIKDYSGINRIAVIKII